VATTGRPHAHVRNARRPRRLRNEHAPTRLHDLPPSARSPRLGARDRLAHGSRPHAPRARRTAPDPSRRSPRGPERGLRLGRSPLVRRGSDGGLERAPRSPPLPKRALGGGLPPPSRRLSRPGDALADPPSHAPGSSGPRPLSRPHSCPIARRAIAARGRGHAVGRVSSRASTVRRLPYLQHLDGRGAPCRRASGRVLGRPLRGPALVRTSSGPLPRPPDRRANPSVIRDQVGSLVLTRTP
jgi:hypothetical protein